MTTANTTGDFKNSGTPPRSNDFPKNHPAAQPSTTEKSDAAKNKRNEFNVTSPFRKRINSNAKTASNAPNGSTTIPSHFKMAAGLGFNFAWRKSGKMTVGPVTMNSPPIINATDKDNPAT